MELVFALMVGTLYSCALYMLLRRSLVKLIVGLILLGAGSNLLIFTAAGLVRGHPPLIPSDTTSIAAPYADPVPQALILTAIVISFGVTIFAVALIYRTTRTLGTDDADDLTETDRLGEVSERGHIVLVPVTVDTAAADRGNDA